MSTFIQYRLILKKLEKNKKTATNFVAVSDCRQKAFQLLNC